MLTERAKVKPATAIIIAVIGVAIIAGLMTYLIIRSLNNPMQFHRQWNSLGERYLSEVRAYDYESEYPETPNEVIEINNKLMKMIYGRMVADDVLLEELVQTQRKLLSDYLTNNNPIEEQLRQIQEDTETLYSNSVYLYQIDVGTIYNSDERDMAIVPLTFTMVNYETLYWNYFLKMENGRWKIHSFERTDNTFLNVIED